MIATAADEQRCAAAIPEASAARRTADARRARRPLRPVASAAARASARDGSGWGGGLRGRGKAPFGIGPRMPYGSGAFQGRHPERGSLTLDLAGLKQPAISTYRAGCRCASCRGANAE